MRNRTGLAVPGMKSWSVGGWLRFQLPIWLLIFGVSFCALGGQASVVVGVTLIALAAIAEWSYRDWRKAQRGVAANALAHGLLEKHGLLLDTNDQHDPRSRGWVDPRSTHDGDDDWCGAA